MRAVKVVLWMMVLIGLTGSYTYADQTSSELNVLILSQDGSEIEDCSIKKLSQVVGQNINPYQGMDVLSFMANMEEAVEKKADVVILPNSILMERENSILNDYLKKLSSENNILFIAPKVNSKKNIFNGWKSVDLLTVKSGGVRSVNYRINGKLEKFSKLLGRLEGKEKKLTRLQLFL
ncbi:MAG: hypothetical protein VX642_14275 [Bdellovibrionota bacterium]|nr:hypothetical protein [Bdellovibrionota bacterium]